MANSRGFLVVRQRSTGSGLLQSVLQAEAASVENQKRTCVLEDKWMS